MAAEKKKKPLLLKILTVVVAVAAILFVVDVLVDDEEDGYGTGGSAVGYGTYGTDLDISGLRDFYSDDASAENVTIMVYMIGSDLESDSGCASSDLEEMMDATYGDNLNIVVQTGGASSWDLDIDARTRQRWLINDDGMTQIGNAGSGSMLARGELQDFIEFAADACPADRYMLVLWDHGGGTMGGFGYDELHSDDGYTIIDVAEEIDESGVLFNIVGFDACLMATVETAYALEPYADYLLASEEYEPGNGWYYTDFITEWAKEPSMDSVQVGAAVIDSFGAYYDNDEVTLSLVSLREVPYVYENLGNFLAAAQEDISVDNSNYRRLSTARSNAREYCDGQIDQIDMADLVKRTEFEGKEELLAAIESCVKYRNNSSLTGSYGLAMYFPYTSIGSYTEMRSLLSDVGFQEPLEFYNYFLSIMAGGQARNRSVNGIGTAAAVQDYSTEAWYTDYQTDFDYGDEYGELELTETEEGFELVLSDDVWELITDVQLSVDVVYEDGYLELGNDNVTSWSESGNLLVDFDYTWVSIDGQPVAFYADDIYEDETKIVYSGRTYALLNGEKEIVIELEWDPVTDAVLNDENAYIEGHVKGYREINENTLTQEKGLRTFKSGDTIDFEFDFYNSDGEYDSTILVGDTVTVTSQDKLTVSYEELADFDVLCWYTLKDIYQQYLYTETISIELE